MPYQRQLAIFFCHLKTTPHLRPPNLGPTPGSAPSFVKKKQSGAGFLSNEDDEQAGHATRQLRLVQRESFCDPFERTNAGHRGPKTGSILLNHSLACVVWAVGSLMRDVTLRASARSLIPRKRQRRFASKAEPGGRRKHLPELFPVTHAMPLDEASKSWEAREIRPDTTKASLGKDFRLAQVELSFEVPWVFAKASASGFLGRCWDFRFHEAPGRRIFLPGCIQVVWGKVARWPDGKMAREALQNGWLPLRCPFQATKVAPPNKITPTFWFL